MITPDPFSVYLASNPVFLGACSLIVNIGARFIVTDLTPTQEYIIKLPIVKAFILLCMCFLITRDVRTSFVLMCGFYLVFYALLNEKSQFNIIPRFIRDRVVGNQNHLVRNTNQATPEEFAKRNEENIKAEIGEKHSIFRHIPKV